MSALTLTVIQLGFLAVLWSFVLIAISVMRSDLFGVRVSRKAGASSTKPISPTSSKPARASKPKRGTPATLMIIDGAATGSTAPLTPSGVTLGRAADNTLPLTDDYVSSHHARFFARDGAWYVEDLGSTNGTHVGQIRITAPVQVSVGSTVRLGKTVVEVRR